MPKTPKQRISAGEIVERASRGEDVSEYFTNEFTVVRRVKRVNLDLTPGMLRHLLSQAPVSSPVRRAAPGKRTGLKGRAR